jgi:TRAP-type C4-dicarboxylate transport system substrate-binding protein
VADAIYTTLYTYVSGKIYEVAPKALIWPSRATYVWVIHREFWNGLTTEDRQTIRRLVDRATDEYHQVLVDEHDDMVRHVHEARDGELEELTPAEIEAFRSRLNDLLVNWHKEYAPVLEGITDGGSS